MPLMKRIEQCNKDGGVFLKELSPGTVIYVDTDNREYRIDVMGDDKIRIEGHSTICPEPTAAVLNGSTFGGSVLKIGWIGINMHLEVMIGDMTMTTSKIKKIEILAEHYNMRIE